MLSRIHHRSRSLCAVKSGKRAVSDLVFFINVFPLSVEQNGVYQIHYGVRVKIIDDFFYHAVGILLYPVVDIPQCFHVKRRLVYRSAVVIRILL